MKSMWEIDTMSWENNSKSDADKYSDNRIIQIDEMIRKSVDNFIFETKDIFKPTLITQFDENLKFENFDHVKQNAANMNPHKNNNTFQRSASQNYDYRRPQIANNETRSLHISPNRYPLEPCYI